MKINKERIYLILFCVYGMISIIDQSLLTIVIISQMVKLVTTGGLFFLFCSRRKIVRKKLVLCALICVLFCIAAFITDKQWILVSALFVLCAENTTFDKILKCSFFTTLITMLFIFSCSWSGLVEDYKWDRTDGVAHCFGFYYYSTPAFLIFYLILIYLVSMKTISYKKIIMLVVLNYLSFYLFQTRLVYILGGLTIILYLIIVKIGYINITCKFVKFMTKIAATGLMTATFVGAVLYSEENKLWYRLNQLLNNRLYYSRKALEDYPLSFFGSRVEMVGNAYGEVVKEYFYIDSGYMYSLVGCGLLFSILVIIMYTVIFCDVAEKNNKPLFIYVFVVLIFTLINNTWLNISYNPILLYFMFALKTQKGIKIGNKRIMIQ